ncbi:MAG: thrombospondin type 3 repeat-containing protein [Candidatus Altiarchaeota archaeon]
MKKTITTFLLLVLIAGIASAFDSNWWRYYKEISIPVGVSEPVKVALDSEVLLDINPDGSDLKVTENGVEIPFKYYSVPSTELAHAGSIISVSSIREPYGRISFSGDKMLDGDYSTVEGSAYQCDYAVDPDKCWFILDLNERTLSSLIKIWASNSQYTWNGIMIEGSDDLSSWTTVKRETFYNVEWVPEVREVYYPQSTFRYLKVTLWHTQSLMIGEVEVYGPQTALILFKADSQKSYKLYYSNPTAVKVDYNLGGLFENKTTPLLTLGVQKVNPAWNSDIDNDGINNNEDNCLLAANPNQKDSDGDRLGDACDNCPNKANRNQRDSDRNSTDSDNTGDVCDNCPGVINPDQLDSNVNGIGDLCDDGDGDGVIDINDNCPKQYNRGQEDSDKDTIGDACDPEDGRITENKYVMWASTGIAIVIVVILALGLSRKKVRLSRNGE